MSRVILDVICEIKSFLFDLRHCRKARCASCAAMVMTTHTPLGTPRIPKQDKRGKLLCMLREIYEQGVGSPPGIEQSNQLLIEVLFERLPANWQDDIPDFFRVKGFIFGRVRNRRENNYFFRQPIALLAYYLVSAMPEQTKEIWPLDPVDLDLVFSDLGKN